MLVEKVLGLLGNDSWMQSLFCQFYIKYALYTKILHPFEMDIKQAYWNLGLRGYNKLSLVHFISIKE